MCWEQHILLHLDLLSIQHLLRYTRLLGSWKCKQANPHIWECEHANPVKSDVITMEHSWTVHPAQVSHHVCDGTARVSAGCSSLWSWSLQIVPCRTRIKFLPAACLHYKYLYPAEVVIKPSHMFGPHESFLTMLSPKPKSPHINHCWHNKSHSQLNQAKFAFPDKYLVCLMTAR